MTLKIDPARAGIVRLTGIFVRAEDSSGVLINTDIATLERASLVKWLRARGGENEWAEKTLLYVLGYSMEDF